MHPLVAYSRVFNFVEVNTTFYEIPKIESVKAWRKIAPNNFTFSVRCNKKLTHELEFNSVPENFEILGKMTEICNVLKSEFLHFQTPPSFDFDRTNTEKLKNFFESVDKTDIRFVLEPRTRKPLNPLFVKVLEDQNIIHCVDLLKGKLPIYKSNILYTRLFGKGYHNIYQPLDSELKNVYNIASGKEFKKAVITVHSNRMFKDAGRFKIYKETGEFPKVTKSVGVDSLAEVLGEDAIFPSSKQELINHQGWKVIDLTPSKRVHARNLLQELPEKTYYGIQDITQALGDL